MDIVLHSAQPLQTIYCGRVPDSSRVEQRCAVTYHHSGVDEFLPCENQQPLCRRSDQVRAGLLRYAVNNALIWARQDKRERCPGLRVLLQVHQHMQGVLWQD